MEHKWNIAQNTEQSSWNYAVSYGDIEIQRGISVFRFLETMELSSYQDLNNITIIDIGGGYSSVLPIFTNYKYGIIVDPIKMPDNLIAFYKERKISVVEQSAEDFLLNYSGEKYDEIWMYNCLKHTYNPNFILSSLPKVGKKLRICELLDNIIDAAHLWILNKDELFNTLSKVSKTYSIHEQHRMYDIYLDMWGGVFELDD